MPKIKQRYVEVIQTNDGAQHVMFLPTNMELCRFILSKKASSTRNAQLVKAVEQAFEVYFKDTIG
ncbi:MAG: hypothetical protein PHX08_10580 [Lachnospiraceae bacterium]|jgi:hypothetical protein|nr:hypothetical protein [Lachnospiraceae bacterium]